MRVGVNPHTEEFELAIDASDEEFKSCDVDKQLADKTADERRTWWRTGARRWW